MIPRPRLLQVVTAAGIVMILALAVNELTILGIAINLFIAGIAAIDFLRTSSQTRLELSREISEVLSVGASNPVTVRAFNHGEQGLQLEIEDDRIDPSTVSGLPLLMHVAAHREAEATYHVVPQHRGPAHLEHMFIRFNSPWGLWSRQARRRVESKIRVYPDIRTVGRLELLGRRNQLSELGLKLWRLKGRQGEFERLREYRRGDEIRQIDWNATAKNHRLISREFTVERNQNIVLLLDCGRAMFNETGGISHLDRALNASIVLSYIALSQGDNVSFMAFSDRIERVVGPMRGKRGVQSLIRQTYDLKARMETSDYGLACEESLRRYRKRSLVLLVTYALDEQHLNAMARYLSGISSTHLFLCTFIKDLPLAELASSRPSSTLRAHQVGAATQMLGAQARRIRSLKERGLHVTEVAPDDLAAEIINRYLGIKAQHLL